MGTFLAKNVFRSISFLLFGLTTFLFQPAQAIAQNNESSEVYADAVTKSFIDFADEPQVTHTKPHKDSVSTYLSPRAKRLGKTFKHPEFFRWQPEDINVLIPRLLGAKSFFATWVKQIHRGGVFKPEILVGQVTEGTIWYQSNWYINHNINVWACPGVSYSFDKGQGFRVRGQYGIGLGRIAERFPVGVFFLVNTTYDFHAKHLTKAWYNVGIQYPVSKRVQVLYDWEGYLDGGFRHNDANPESGIYTQSNFGLVINMAKKI